MTFLPRGKLTATFPGPTPDAPPALQPGEDGFWCFTGPNAFRYQFKDPLVKEGNTLVAFVQTHVDVTLFSSTEYSGGGAGVAYQQSSTGVLTPIPHQAGSTSTIATGQ